MTLIQLLNTIIVLVSISAFGWLLVSSIEPSLSVLEAISLSFPLGGGLLTWILFLLSWLGVQLSATNVLIVYLVLIIMTVLMGKKSTTTNGIGSEPPIGLLRSRYRLATLSLATLIATIILTVFLIAVGSSYHAWDAMVMWGIKGMGIAREQSIFGGEIWGAHRLSYPLNIHLLVSLFNVAIIDVIPGSKLIFPTFLVSGLLYAYSFWRRNGLEVTWGLLGVLFLATVSIHFVHATIGYANLAMGVYILIGTILGARALLEESRGQAILAGVALGLATWTIIEGMFFSAVVACALIVLSMRWGTARSIRVFLTVPIVAIGGAWLTFYSIYGASGSQAMDAASEMIESISNGEYNLYAFRMMFGYFRRFLIRPSPWGLFFPAGIVMLIVGWRTLTDEIREQALALVLTTMATGALCALLFYLRYFVSEDFYAYLIRGFPRQFIATSLIFGTLSVLVGGQYVRAVTSTASRPGGSVNSQEVASGS